MFGSSPPILSIPLRTISITEIFPVQYSSVVEDGFTAVFSKVEQAMELSPLDHATAMDLESWEVSGNSGTIAGFKGKKVC